MQRGFTLLETLVAAFILFIVINATTYIFQSSIKSVLTADKYVKPNSLAPLLMDDIRVELSFGVYEGEGDILGRRYSWIAAVVKQASIKPISVASEGNTVVSAGSVAVLYQVDLTLTEKNKTFNYQFNVTSVAASS